MIPRVAMKRCLSHPFSSSTYTEASPYLVLGVPAHSTLPEIRRRYRELVRLHHPDSGGPDASTSRMADITSAYRKLTGRAGSDGGGNQREEGSEDLSARDSRVATAVRVAAAKGLSVESLEDGDHDVFPVRVTVDEILAASAPPDAQTEKGPGQAGEAASTSAAAASTSNSKGEAEGWCSLTASSDVGDVVASSAPEVVHTTSLDSVADLKRDLQGRFGERWSLAGRRRDRERLAVGWELVGDLAPRRAGSAGGGLCVLGNTFFVGDYGVRSGETLFAVVRRYPSS